MIDNELEKLFALVKLMEMLRKEEDGSFIVDSSLMKFVHEQYQEKQPDGYNPEMLNVIIGQCERELKDYLLNHLGGKYGGLITVMALVYSLIGIEMAHHQHGDMDIIQAINQDLDKALTEMGVEVVWLKD